MCVKERRNPGIAAEKGDQKGSPICDATQRNATQRFPKSTTRTRRLYIAAATQSYSSSLRDDYEDCLYLIASCAWQLQRRIPPRFPLLDDPPALDLHIKQPTPTATSLLHY